MANIFDEVAGASTPSPAPAAGNIFDQVAATPPPPPETPLPDDPEERGFVMRMWAERYGRTELADAQGRGQESKIADFYKSRPDVDPILGSSYKKADDWDRQSLADFEEAQKKFPINYPSKVIDDPNDPTNQAMLAQDKLQQEYLAQKDKERGPRPEVANGAIDPVTKAPIRGVIGVTDSPNEIAAGMYTRETTEPKTRASIDAQFSAAFRRIKEKGEDPSAYAKRIYGGDLHDPSAISEETAQALYGTPPAAAIGLDPVTGQEVGKARGVYNSVEKGVYQGTLGAVGKGESFLAHSTQSVKDWLNNTKATNSTFDPQRSQDQALSWSQRMAEGDQAILGLNPGSTEAARNPGGLEGTLEHTTQAGTALATSLFLTGGATASGQAARTAAQINFFGQTAGATAEDTRQQAYNALTSQGVDPVTADRKAVGVGLVSAAVSTFLNARLGVGGRVAGTAEMGATNSLLTRVTESVTNNLIASRGSDAFNQILQYATTGKGIDAQEFISGALTDAILGTGVAVVHGGLESRVNRLNPEIAKDFARNVFTRMGVPEENLNEAVSTVMKTRGNMKPGDFAKIAEAHGSPKIPENAIVGVNNEAAATLKPGEEAPPASPGRKTVVNETENPPSKETAITPAKAPEAPPAPEVKEETPPPAPPKTKDTTGLAGMGGGLAGAATGNLYDSLFESLKKGSTKMGGIEDPVLRFAKPAFDRGEITTPEQLRDYVAKNYNKPADAPSPASPAKLPGDDKGLRIAAGRGLGSPTAETENGTKVVLSNLPIGRVTPDGKELTTSDGGTVDLAAIHRLRDPHGNIVWERDKPTPPKTPALKTPAPTPPATPPAPPAPKAEEPPAAPPKPKALPKSVKQQDHDEVTAALEEYNKAKVEHEKTYNEDGTRNGTREEQKAAFSAEGEARDKFDAALEKYYEKYPDEDLAPEDSEPLKPAEKQNLDTGVSKIAAALHDHLGTLKPGDKLKSIDVSRIASKAMGGSKAQGTFDVKSAYDALEAAVNKYLMNAIPGPVGLTPHQVKLAIAEINKLHQLTPTQTNRTEETDKLQQFSTPPAYAYVVAWAGNPKAGESAIEPSAGVGGLAIWMPDGTVVNELAPRRAELLRWLGFKHVETENAEQLNNILPDNQTFSLVVMNPPFSSTVDIAKRDVMAAAKHIEAIWPRLQEGGRLVAIVGEGMGVENKRYAEFFDKMEPYLRANVGVDGDVYKKHGTHFGTRVLVFDKAPRPADVDVVRGDVQSLDDLVDLLKGVHDARIEPRGDSGESAPDQSSLQGETPGSGIKPVAGDAVSNPAPPVGGSGGGVRRNPRGGKPGTKAQPPRAGKPATGGGDEGIVPTGPGGGDRGVTGPGGSEGGGGESSAGRGGGAKPQLVTQQPEKAKGELTDKVFEPYKPYVTIEGAKPHVSPLVESAAMATVMPPKPTYTPKLPKEIIESGKVSDAQIEQVIYAGNAHQQILPNGQRRGYFNGDGTGVGKGRTNVAIFVDNWMQGRKKGVWVSENFRLFPDAQRDWTALGMPEDKLFSQDKVKAGTAIASGEGVLFTGYGTLRKDRKGPKSRIKQIIDWLGKDFDGVICFDEAHNGKNATTRQGARGSVKPSQVAEAMLELQEALPNARVVYVSATGATEVANFGYADRLGLWGDGTPFNAKADFINKINGSGLSGMELVAQNLKQMGVYLSRTLSFEGSKNDPVRYDTLTHTLSDDQVGTYNKLTEAWQIVLRNFDAALQLTASDHHGKVDRQARMSAYSKFWGAHQRFFNQVITAMKLPSVLADIQKELDGGNSVVVQLTNTQEAALDRALSEMGEDDDLESLDLTPRKDLMQMVERAFPVHQYHEVIDAHGNSSMELTRDSKGNPVVNREALAMREKLMAEVGSIKVPDGPIETIINHFGVDNVAENTGRTQRVVDVQDEGQLKATRQARGKSHALADVQAFNDGTKRILVFSQAGGTGASYHSDLNYKNQQRRIHYLLQPGWSADKAIQGFGRTHRTNQAKSPSYRLIASNLDGEKRFISTIARRLDQLGALTRGQRQAGAQGIFKPTDNLESRYAQDGLQQFIRALNNGQIEGLTLGEFERQTGLELRDRQTGSLRAESLDMRRFLNRLLSLDVAMQGRVFRGFMERYEATVDRAIRTGEFDQGLENLTADAVIKNDEQIAYTDPSTGAITKLVNFTLKNRTHPLTWEKASKLGELRFMRNSQSGRIYAVMPTGTTETLASGRVVDRLFLYAPSGASKTVNELEIAGKNWEEVARGDAQAPWKDAVSKVPPFNEEPLHLISGAILPIWDRIIGQGRVFRIQSDDGERFIGRTVSPADLPATLKRLGLNAHLPKWTPAETLTNILTKAATIELSNGWTITRRLVSGEARVEIDGPKYHDMDVLKKYGVFLERVGYQTRYFIPVDKPEILAKVLKFHPMVEVTSGRTRDDDDLTTQYAGLPLPKWLQPRPRPEQPFNAPPGLLESAIAGVEARKEAARLVSPSFLDRVLERAKTFLRQSVPGHHFAELDYKRDGVTINVLREFEAAKNWAHATALTFLHNVTEGMKPEHYKVYSELILLDDLIRDVDGGLYDENAELPFGYKNLDEIKTDREKYCAIADANPVIDQALAKRADVIGNLTHELVRMDLLDAGVLQDPRYYHHQVIAHAQEKLNARAGGGTGDLHERTKGFQISRKGSSQDYNTAYHEAEFEFMAQALEQIRAYETREKLKAANDRYAELKAEAKSRNEEAIVAMVAAEIMDNNPGTSAKDALEMALQNHPLSPFRKKIAIATRQLIGELLNPPMDPHPILAKYDELIDALHEARQQWLNDTAGMDAKDRPPFTFDHPDWFRMLADFANLHDADNLALPARGFFKAIADREAFLKQALGKKYLKWQQGLDERILPPGFVMWQPDPGNFLFRGQTVAEQLVQQGLDVQQIATRDIRGMMVMGGPKETWVIPDRMARQFDKLRLQRDEAAASQLLRIGTSIWKRYILTMPLRLVRYNLNNMIGDVSIAMAYDPAILKRAPQAARDLIDFHKTKKMDPDISEGLRRGILGSGLTVQEVPEITQQDLFAYLTGDTPSLYSRTLGRYINATRELSDLRENIIRLAAFRYFRGKVTKGSVYAASSKPQVDAIKDPAEKAAKLARELIGDYGNLSPTGQWLRAHLVPFYSWIEVNAPRYVRLLRNTRYEGGHGAKNGAGSTMGRLLMLGLKASALMALAFLWNNTVQKENEDKLTRKSPHIVLGRTKDGEVRAVYFNDALADALQWFGADDALDDLKELIEGKKSLKQEGDEAWRAFASKALNSVNPLYRLPFELTTGRSISQDFKPTIMRDKGEHVAKMLALDAIYRRVFGMPVRKGAGNLLFELVQSKTDPGEAAYYESRALVQDYLRAQGKESEGAGDPTDRENALYYYKQSLRFGDDAAAKKYLEQYLKLGGTMDTLHTSIKKGNPLGALPAADKEKFLSTLDPDQKKILELAQSWYQGAAAKVPFPDDIRAKDAEDVYVDRMRALFKEPASLDRSKRISDLEQEIAKAALPGGAKLDPRQVIARAKADPTAAGYPALVDAIRKGDQNAFNAAADAMAAEHKSPADMGDTLIKEHLIAPMTVEKYMRQWSAAKSKAP